MKKMILAVMVVLMAMTVIAGAESVNFGPSAAYMDVPVAIGSPTTTGLQEYYVDGTFNANVMATGAGLTYDWLKDGLSLVDGGSISGATTTNLTITPLVPGDAGVYTCVITGTCGAPATTSDITVVIYDHLAVVPPVDAYVCLLDTIDMVIVVSGGKLPYDIVWSYNGTSLVDGPSDGGGVISGAGDGTPNSGTVNLQITNAGLLDAILPGYDGVVIDALLINTPDL